MYELKLPQPLTTVRIDDTERDTWLPAIIQELKAMGFKVLAHDNFFIPFLFGNTVIVIDSAQKTAMLQAAKYKICNERGEHLYPSVRQVLKVNNNAVLYDRLHEHADGSLGNTILSSMHLMD